MRPHPLHALAAAALLLAGGAVGTAAGIVLAAPIAADNLRAAIAPDAAALAACAERDTAEAEEMRRQSAEAQERLRTNLRRLREMRDPPPPPPPGGQP